jgi:predicted nucleotide-binding protein
MKGYSIYSDFSDLYDRIKQCVDDQTTIEFLRKLDKLHTVSEEIGQSWSKSWLGYHSCVYYRDFQTPPNDAIFDSIWGLQDRFYSTGTRGDWQKYNYETVAKYIQKTADVEIDSLSEIYTGLKHFFDEIKSEINSLFSILIKDIPDDSFLNEMSEAIKSIDCYSRKELVSAMAPKGAVMTNDMLAISTGSQCPPHLTIIAIVCEYKSPIIASKKALVYCKRIITHMKKFNNFQNSSGNSKNMGTRVFIGHGQSKLWRELKDFIQDRIHLSWDEFNRVPIAGITNITRLSEMMENAAIAFLILTAEDEQHDGKINPRMNVVHEAGLFQGRLGFPKAIILLEDGCEEFSNINGLGQIRFPTGKISAIFEEVRLVLEREGLINEE